MPGLPFVSLADAVPGAERDYLGNAQYQHVKQNERELDVERAMGRPWIEPMWDLSAQQGQTPEQNRDPSNVFDQQIETMRKEKHSSLDAVEPQITGSISNDIKTEMTKYNLDRDALEASDLDPDEKRRRSMQLNLQYQKRGAELRGKIQPDLDSLATKHKEVDVAINAIRERGYIKLQTIQETGKEMGLSDDQILRQKFKAIGITIPEPPKPQTPRQALAEVVPTLKHFEEEQSYYITVPAKKGHILWGGAAPEKLKILKPEWRTSRNVNMDYEGNEDLFQDATPEETRYYEQLQQEISSLTEQERIYRGQILGKHVPTLSIGQQTPNPMAQGITVRHTTTEPNDITQLSDAEIEAELARLR